MALIICSDCQTQVSDRAAFCLGCGGPVPGEKAQVSDKDRFDLCVAMMKAYYDAIEARLTASITAFLLIIGWLIASEETRKALHSHLSFTILAVIALAIATAMYSWNIVHWIRRWREILQTTRSLDYIEPRFYSRYERLPDLTWLIYISPIALMSMLIIVFVVLIHFGWVYQQAGEPLSRDLPVTIAASEPQCH